MIQIKTLTFRHFVSLDTRKIHILCRSVWIYFQTRPRQMWNVHNLFLIANWLLWRKCQMVEVGKKSWYVFMPIVLNMCAAEWAKGNVRKKKKMRRSVRKSPKLSGNCICAWATKLSYIRTGIAMNGSKGWTFLGSTWSSCHDVFILLHKPRQILPFWYLHFSV